MVPGGVGAPLALHRLFPVLSHPPSLRPLLACVPWPPCLTGGPLPFPHPFSLHVLSRPHFYVTGLLEKKPWNACSLFCYLLKALAIAPSLPGPHPLGPCSSLSSSQCPSLQNPHADCPLQRLPPPAQCPGVSSPWRLPILWRLPSIHLFNHVSTMLFPIPAPLLCR